jgi:hypothetical protein
MAGRGISIDILANVRDALQGTGDVEKALSDIEATLDDMGRSGESSVDRMSRGFRDLARDADTSSDKIERSYKTTYRDVARAADTAADDAERSQRRIGEKSAEVGQEVRQNLGEGIANAARGDFESLADTIGDTFGGAVAGIGGIASAGLAAAGALGIGALVAALSAAEEKLSAARERAVELAATMYENQGQIPLAERAQELIQILGSERAGNNLFENIAANFLDLGTNIDAARESAQEANIPLERLVRALSGTDLKQSKSALDDVNDAIERMGELSGFDFGEDEARRLESLKSMRTELEKVVESSELANELYSSTDFLNTQRIDELSTAWQNAATDAGNYFSETEEGATSFDWSTYLADAEETIAAADEMKSRLVGLPSDIRAEAERIFSQQGAVAANEYTKAYESASAADRGRFENAARANGAAAGQAQAQGLKDAFGNPVVDATVRVGVDDWAWRNWRPTAKVGTVFASGIKGVNWQ